MLMPDGFAVLVKAKASIAKPMATTIPVTTMLENNYDLVPHRYYANDLICSLVTVSPLVIIEIF